MYKHCFWKSRLLQQVYHLLKWNSNIARCLRQINTSNFINVSTKYKVYVLKTFDSSTYSQISIRVTFQKSFSEVRPSHASPSTSYFLSMSLLLRHSLPSLTLHKDSYTLTNFFLITFHSQPSTFTHKLLFNFHLE